MTAIDALSIVRHNARIASGDPWPGAKVMYEAAKDLWDAEFAAWQALRAIGMTDAARCAWQRRTAAAELTSILVTTL